MRRESAAALSEKNRDSDEGPSNRVLPLQFKSGALKRGRVLRKVGALNDDRKLHARSLA
jgi:hypothetical protein